MNSNPDQQNPQNTQDIQTLEQSLQNILMQKQSLQLELSETESALSELENSGDEVYRVIGQMMVKSEKNKMKQDLEKQKEFLNLRLKNLEQQESSIYEKIESLRKGESENTPENTSENK